MDVNNLNIFVRAAELGSVTKAAEELGYTQSAGSHILSRLEKELGVPLLQRTHNGVCATHIGLQLIPLAKELLAKQNELYYMAHAASEHISGLVRVGSITSVAVQWLPKIIDRFTELNKGVQIQIRDGSYEDVECWLCDKSVDCGFLSSVSDSKLMICPLEEDPLLVVLPEEHPLCRLSEIPIEALKNEKFLVPAEGLSYDVGQILKQANIKTIPNYNIISDYSAIALVRQGYGITIMPQLLLGGCPVEGIALRRLSPNKSRMICLAGTQESYQSFAVSSFISFVQKWVTDQQNY